MACTAGQTMLRPVSQEQPLALLWNKQQGSTVDAVHIFGIGMVKFLWGALEAFSDTSA